MVTEVCVVTCGREWEPRRSVLTHAWLTHSSISLVCVWCCISLTHTHTHTHRCTQTDPAAAHCQPINITVKLCWTHLVRNYREEMDLDKPWITTNCHSSYSSSVIGWKMTVAVPIYHSTSREPMTPPPVSHHTVESWRVKEEGPVAPKRWSMVMFAFSR